MRDLLSLAWIAGDNNDVGDLAIRTGQVAGPWYSIYDDVSALWVVRSSGYFGGRLTLLS